MVAPTDTPALTNPLDALMGYRLRRASAMMMADLGKRLDNIGLRPVEASALMLIGHNNGCIQSDVGKLLGVKRANMVPLIGGMIKNGLVERTPVDGRSQSLTLTPQGKSLLAQVKAIIDTHENDFRQRLPSRTLARFLDNLDTIRAE